MKQFKEILRFYYVDVSSLISGFGIAIVFLEKFLWLLIGFANVMRHTRAEGSEINFLEIVRGFFSFDGPIGTHIDAYDFITTTIPIVFFFVCQSLAAKSIVLIFYLYILWGAFLVLFSSAKFAGGLLIDPVIGGWGTIEGVGILAPTLMILYLLGRVGFSQMSSKK